MTQCPFLLWMLQQSLVRSAFLIFSILIEKKHLDSLYVVGLGLKPKSIDKLCCKE